VASESPQAIERIPVDFLAHPHELFDRLRAQGRARRVVMPHGAKVWLVTRYEDVRSLLNDPRISKDGRRMDEMYVRNSRTAGGDEAPVETGFDLILSQHMLNTDPPRHTRLRAQVSNAFTAAAMRRLRPRIEQVTGELLDAMAGKAEVDLVSEFTVPLPLIMICDLHGIPPEDRAAWQRWSTWLVGSGHPADEVAAAGQAVIEYVTALIKAKRAHPGEDLVSGWAQIVDADDGRLSHDELVAMIFVLIAAGLDTPMRQLGLAIYTLLTWPDQLAALRTDLSLMPAAVDELMRYDGTVAMSSFRFTTADIEVGEVTIPAGEMLLLPLASANRDSAQFADPELLDLHRPQRGNLAFGHGPHYCIGAHLARLEIQVGLSQLITRYPDLQLAVDPGELRWENGNLLRCLEELPVLLGPQTGSVTAMASHDV
jgi:cytochrome P450